MSRTVVAVESFVDALVGCFGLAVDAMGVGLEQDGDAVADAASDFGGGNAGVQQQRHGGGASQTEQERNRRNLLRVAGLSDVDGTG